MAQPLDDVVERAAYLPRVVDPVVNITAATCTLVAGMASKALDEFLEPLEDMSTDMPNVISRWDSHETSPMLAEAAKPALMTVAYKPYNYRRQRRTQGKVLDRGQIMGLQAPNDSKTQSSMKLDINDDDDENCNKEIILSDALIYEQDQELHVSQVAVPYLSKSARPSRAVLLGQNGEDIHEIGQWYFACQLPEQEYKFFESVQNHWVKDIWDMGRDNQFIFSVVGAFALHKKATLGSGRAKSEYYEQKGRIIQNIISDIKHSPDGPDPMTIAAMSILAYFDIRDEQHDAAATHLSAVRSFIDMSKMSPQGWLFAAWTDLRKALHAVTEPILPFYVPAVFREIHETLRSRQRESSRMGAINASQCPRSPVFTLDMASDLFGKLHTLCYCSGFAPTETPPFGQVYALEYGLRIMQARAKRSEGDVFSSPIMLVTSAIQLHVWMAARFYTPQARETHLGLIKIACEVIDSFEDMVTQWYIAAGLESLLWVLFTIASSFRVHEIPQTTKILGLLYRALRKARINSLDGFEARLKNWPWITNWHPVQIGIVWEMLCARYPDLVPRIARSDFPETYSDPRRARHRWFVGGFEFFNSL
jgi:hypothetical protein